MGSTHVKVSRLGCAFAIVTPKEVLLKLKDYICLHNYCFRSFFYLFVTRFVRLAQLATIFVSLSLLVIILPIAYFRATVDEFALLFFLLPLLMAFRLQSSTHHSTCPILRSIALSVTTSNIIRSSPGLEWLDKQIMNPIVMHLSPRGETKVVAS
jgi:hypothetical protein